MSFDVSIMDSAGQDGQAAARPISLGLAGLSSGIGALGDVVITVDGVPDAARLSAGQFLGDGTWSVRVADLDRLSLYPSPGRERHCQISIRLRKVDKDMGESFGIGTVYVDVDADAERSTIAGTEGAISLRQKAEQAPPPAPRGFPAEESVPEAPVHGAFPSDNDSDALAPGQGAGLLHEPEPSGLDDPFGDDAEMERIFGGPEQVVGEPSPAASETPPPPKPAAKPVQRVVRVTRAASLKPKPAPVSTEPFPDQIDAAPEAPIPDGSRADQGGQMWSPDAFPAALPIQDSSTPDLTDLGIAPPAAVGEPARSPFAQAPLAPPSPAAAQGSPAERFAKKVPPARNAGGMVVPVQITPGLRIGKFGKRGRPEDVVSVRVHPGGGMSKRADGSRSIVFVRPRRGEIRTV